MFAPQANSYPVVPPNYGGIGNGYGTPLYPPAPPSPQPSPYDPYYNQQARLQEMLRQQQQAVNGVAQSTQVQQPPAPPQITVVAVDNEQQAIDAAADLTGTPQLFVLRDDSGIFAKRFNVKDATVNFTKYVKDTRGEKVPDGKPAEQVNEAFQAVTKSFTTQLNDIQKAISEIKESLKNVQSSRDSKSFGPKQSSNERNYGSNSTDGASRERPVNDNGGFGSPRSAVEE